MKWTYKKDKQGGKWIVILSCPLNEKHCLRDVDVAGPTFAECAYCSYQTGVNYERLGCDGTYDAAEILPERLECGYKASPVPLLQKDTGNNPLQNMGWREHLSMDKPNYLSTNLLAQIKRLLLQSGI